MLEVASRSQEEIEKAAESVWDMVRPPIGPMVDDANRAIWRYLDAQPVSAAGGSV
jgi:hypothetical protein